MPTQLLDIGTIELDTEQYVLVRVDDQQAWKLEQKDEPNIREGLEGELIPYPMDSFHNGALKSREGVPASSEYGQNTDCRFIGKVLPGPKVKTISGSPGPSLLSSNSMFESMGYLWVCSGDSIYRIDSSDTVVLSKDLGGVPLDPVMGIDYNGKPLVTTFPTGDLYYLSAIVAGGPDTWTNDTASGYLLAKGADRIFRVNETGEIRNLLMGLSPIDENNWADKVQAGSTSTGYLPGGFVAYDQTVLVAKVDGMFAVGPEGKAIAIVPQEIATTIPNRCLFSIPPYAVLATNRGTYRFSPGSLESIGIERELLNESIVIGRISAMAFDGRWIYALLVPTGGATNYWLITLKEDQGGFGPYIIDTLTHSTTEMRNLLLSTAYSPPRLFIGRSTTIDYIELGRGGGAPDPLQSGYTFTGGTGGNYRYTNKINLGWETVDLIKIDVVGRNLVAGGTNRTWRIAYSVDGGAFTSLDINGVDMDTTTNGKVTFFIPRTAVGKEWQFRLDYRGTDAQTVGGEILSIVPFFAPRPDKQSTYEFNLRLAGDQVTSMGIDHRSSLDQLNDLNNLSKQGASIDTKGPWGEFQCWIRQVNVIEVRQEGKAEPEFITQISLLRRTEA